MQIACDQVKSAAARLTGQEPPKFEDNERTLDELKARIQRTLDYVKSVPASAYKGAEKRRVGFPLINDLVLDMDSVQYLRDWAFPNFYFHVVTAYDILRNQGVQIGKQDYLAHAAYAIRPKAGVGRKKKTENSHRLEDLSSRSPGTPRRRSRIAAQARRPAQETRDGR